MSGFVPSVKWLSSLNLSNWGYLGVVGSIPGNLIIESNHLGLTPMKDHVENKVVIYDLLTEAGSFSNWNVQKMLFLQQASLQEKT